ncbi:MAG: CBS domain-containing protein [Nitrospiraceae bacterium]|nr:MAG: CBS domain-containing protein [Nitrospiraceae bacterium]
MDVITTHLNADFDALASMVAAKKYYPDAFLVFPGSQEKSVRDFLENSGMSLNIKKLRDINLDDITRLILVDVKNPARIGKLSDIVSNKGKVIHIFDHHPKSEEDVNGHKEVIEPVGATSTIFTEILKKDRMKMTPAESSLLMLGIYEETGSLMFPCTTSRDLMAAAYLLKKGANLNIVSNYIRRQLGPEEIDLLNELIHSSTDHVIHDSRIKITTASRETYIGDISPLAHIIKEIDDVDAIFLLVMMEDRVQVIARSHSQEVDVSEILHDFGGGGHAQASSAVVRDMSLEEVSHALLRMLKEKVHPTKTARDIMTSPVKTIRWSNTIKTAERTMTQYSVNVLPVLKKEDLFGLISREVVEKALFHGFSKNRVSEFCTTDVSSVSLHTSIDVIELMMIEQNQRFLPVVEKEKIVGAITRTDLLRSLYESLLKKNRVRSHEKLSDKPSLGKYISSSIKSKFPSEIVDLLRLCGRVARDLGYSAYLVGGSVRDLILGETNLDIDIVIEGDGIAFARKLGSTLGVKVKSHRKFGTAVVITNILKFDVASARTEYYESPAALPRVEMSSIKKDLYRRDFTINTMAVKLDPDHFGQLLDFFGGQRDLKEKTIRILHNLSFIEDPTRAFRAIRFSERFGFKISKHTLNLIKTAVRINLFNKLSGTRMYDELVLLFVETDPKKAIMRLAELDLLKFIHPSLKITKSLEYIFDSIQETISWFKLLFFEEEINIGHLFLMALLDELPHSDRTELLIRLDVPPSARDDMILGIEKAEDALNKLHKVRQSEIYNTLRPLNIQTVLFVMAKSTDREQKKYVSLYLTSLRDIRPVLTGRDLKTMGYSPGPVFKEILTAVLEAKIDEKVKNRDDEIIFVKKNYPLITT